MRADRDGSGLHRGDAENDKPKADDQPGMLRERFGPFSFLLRLRSEAGRVAWPVESGRFLGVPIPRALLPRSESFEYAGADGRFRFDGVPPGRYRVDVWHESGRKATREVTLEPGAPARVELELR